ncbi:MAG TPA: Gfo/Idh/MocA family oxidoreductase [Candidatus Ligilactobacillus excrementigallinarum]|uniref:Gfo/Idh/MocA family oxidoreductase n=1 Tax=Candidatus Ligilactobacillus excrementigallinarum TaxID=2838641 RepID=A0A9D1UWS4_9LACO|nr:Gfo/Idh/MocA family oxidoreductase [Candidatus Ligilactobacillus excrementigallinarum]
MTKYNWAIVGTGWAASDFALALNAEGEIYAVVNPHREHADEFAERNHVKHTYYDYDKMLADEQVDIVYIATPHMNHYEYIKRALAANKHVFCEKAITVNAAQFDEVQQLAQEKHLILTEGFTLYHMPLYRKLKELIQTGKLGEIKMIQVNFGSLKDPDPTKRYFSKELAGGALLDIGGYATAFVRMFMKQPHVAQTSVKFYQTGVDEMSGIILKNAQEQMAVMSLSFRAKQPKRGVVSGTKGYVEINNYPRANQAEITYTADAHTSTTETLTVGESELALQYEVRDMERYIDQGHDDGELEFSHDVAHILDDVRSDWGMRYPFE